MRKLALKRTPCQENNIIKSCPKGPCSIKCQQPSTPGKITQRSCVYYGARWMLALIKEDAAHLVHATVGCAYYGSTVRGNNYRILSTGLTEKEVIFGGIYKLSKAISETKLLFPNINCIFVYITCTPSLTGDDVYAICQQKEKELGIPIVVVDCPGFKGESQAVGHKIAYRTLMNSLIGKEEREISDFDVNIIGDYNINNESKVLKDLLRRLGINVHCVFTGDCNIKKIKSSHCVRLNLLICQNTGRELANFMKEKYNIPYIPVSFFGLTDTITSLKKIGEFFSIEKKVEKFIEHEYNSIKDKLFELKEKLAGKKAALFFGAARMAIVARALQDLDMEIVFTGSQFADHLTYQETIKSLKKKDTIIIDDASEHDLEHLLEELKPNVFMGGTKENFLSHKLKVGFVLFPQPKIEGPYVGFKGFLNFANSLYKAIYAPVWKFMDVDF